MRWKVSHRIPRENNIFVFVVLEDTNQQHIVTFHLGSGKRDLL